MTGALKFAVGNIKGNITKKRKKVIILCVCVCVCVYLSMLCSMAVAYVGRACLLSMAFLRY